VHASLLPGDFHLPAVDAIILGEGEPTFQAVVAAVEAGRPLAEVPNVVYRDTDGGFRATERSHVALDLDTSPLPRRDLTADARDQYHFLFHRPDTSMATGRGCPYRCNFCSVWQFYGGRTRMMSAERVVRELRTVTTEHVTFVDDNFMLNFRREAEIADRIAAEGIGLSYSME
jgi:radical SAM superfamily enzyme YgiQ (UPF0313 family)